MMAANSLHVAVPLVVLSGASFCRSSACRRACSARAFAPHFAPPSAQPSNVQTSCFERAWPAAPGLSTCAFAGGLAAGAAAPPGRRCPERERRATAEGKIKGRGTALREKPVCTWGERGTRRGTASCREQRQGHAGTGETACIAPSGALDCAGATP